MSHLQAIDKAGLKPFRHHDTEYEQEIRCVPWGALLIGYDEYGNKILEEDSVGDEINWFLWKKSSRKTSGWSMAWPAVVGVGSSQGGGGGQPENHAGFTFEGVETDFSAGGQEMGGSFSGVRTDFSAGGQGCGLDTDLLNQTLADDPGVNDESGTCPNTATGGGGGEDTESAPQMMLPIRDASFSADSRFRSMSLPRPKQGDEDLWPKFPGGTVGVALAGTEEYRQESLFLPTDPRLIAVQEAGDWKCGSMVCDLDADSAIDRLDYQVDPFGLGKHIFPSKMDNMPSANMGDLNTRGLGIKIGRFGAFPKLSSNHRVAVVVTLVPAAPNSIGQFMAVEVGPDEVKDKIPGIGIEPCSGPAWHIHVGHGTITARTAWKDDYADTIERSFGIGITEPDSPEARQALDEQIAADVKKLQELTINYGDLEAAAKAIAAQVWAKLADRYIGTRTVRLAPGIQPKGAIKSVSHRVEMDGRVITEISLPEELQERNWMAMLPESTRRFIFREVQA